MRIRFTILFLLAALLTRAQTDATYKQDYSHGRESLRSIVDSALLTPRFAADPATDGSAGNVYYNTTSRHFRFLENALWVEYGATGAASYTFTNGLNAVGSVAQLGGALTAATNIYGAQALTLGTSVNTLKSLGVYTTLGQSFQDAAGSHATPINFSFSDGLVSLSGFNLTQTLSNQFNLSAPIILVQTLPTAPADTTSFKPVVWNPTTRQVERGVWNGDGNNYPTSLGFAAGTLTVNRLGLTPITVSLDGRYLQTESDPVWASVSGNYYTKTNLQTSGQALVAWGNITGAPAFVVTETDPVFFASPAHGIASTDITHWNTAYNKYPTGVAVSGTTSKTITITLNDLSTLTTAFTDLQGGDGNTFVTSAAFNAATGALTLTRNDAATVTVNLDGRYLTSFTEADPVFVASPAHSIVSTDLTHWNTAYNKYPTALAVAGTSTKTITLTLNDLTTLTASFTDLAGTGGDGNTYVTSSAFNTATGDLNLTRNDAVVVTANLDGRYLRTYTETDPVWTAASANYYTKTNLQTAGQALVAWGNLTGVPGFITSLNGLTTATQTLATGTAGSDFNIVSSGSTHTFNLPDASLTARGLVTILAQSIKGSKTFADNTQVQGTLSVGSASATAATENFATTAGTSASLSVTNGGVMSVMSANKIGFKIGATEYGQWNSAGDFFIYNAIRSATSLATIDNTGKVQTLANGVVGALLVINSSGVPGWGGTQYSLQNNAGNLQLVGDLASPSAWAYYGTDGSGVKSWNSFSTALSANLHAAGSDTWVQYNNGGGFGASNRYTYANTARTLTVGLTTQDNNVTQYNNGDLLQQDINLAGVAKKAYFNQSSSMSMISGQVALGASGTTTFALSTDIRDGNILYGFEVEYVIKSTSATRKGRFQVAWAGSVLTSQSDAHIEANDVSGGLGAFTVQAIYNSAQARVEFRATNFNSVTNCTIIYTIRALGWPGA